MSIKIKDNGADELMKILGKEITIRVGVMGEKASAAHTGSEETVADIASKHEFGIDVPQRSFIRDWVDQKMDDIKKWLQLLPRAALKNQPLEAAAETIALAMVGSIQERISEGIAPALSPVTIAKKGSTTPLIDTGQLRSSITGESEVK